MVAELSRRAVLTGCGAACVSVLAGCGAGAEPGQPASIASPTKPVAPSASPTGPPRPPGFLAKLTDVPVGGGTIADSTVLVVQPVAGTVRAYDARCPHAGTIVGTPDGSGVITCPAHGAHYRATDGSLIDGPAPHGLTLIPVHVSEGVVTRS